MEHIKSSHYLVWHGFYEAYSTHSPPKSLRCTANPPPPPFPRLLIRRPMYMYYLPIRTLPQTCKMDFTPFFLKKYLLLVVWKLFWSTCNTVIIIVASLFTNFCQFAFLLIIVSIYLQNTTFINGKGYKMGAFHHKDHDLPSTNHVTLQLVLVPDPAVNNDTLLVS